MAKVSQDRMMKSLVAKVKELYTETDDEAIQIVLQQYDFSVEQTVQAFLDGAAEESLREWKSLGSGTKTTASKKKKKNKNKHPAQNQENSNPQSAPAAKDVAPEISMLCNGGISSTSTLVNGCRLSELDVAVVKEQQHSRVPAYEPPPQKSSVQPTRSKEDYKQMTKKSRDRTISEASTSSAIDKPSKNPHAGLEKSCKDLQRQTVSLQRLKTVLNDHLEKSFKRISEVFKELHNQLNEREAQLIFDMDKVKTQANDVLEDQQRKAAELKHQTDRAQVMKDAAIADLRTKIKLFVSDRKHYEDLSNAQRFVCDFNHVLEELKNFGEVVPVKTNPDHRRASVASLGSSISHEDVTSPSKSSSGVPNLTSQMSSSSQSAAPTAAVHTAAAPTAAVHTAAVPKAAVPKAAAPIAAAPVIPNSAHVLMQSESLTKYEATEMAQRLANLTLNDSKELPASAHVRNVRSDRGRSSRGRGGGTSAGSSDRGAKPNSGEPQRDLQSARSQGQSRGGRGQGRSNRGQGQTRSATESNSQRSESANAQSPENNEANGPASPKNSSNRQAAQPKSPNSPRRGTRQGGRRDGGQRTSGDSSVKAEATAKQHFTESHNDSSGAADKTGDALPVSSKPAVDGLMNGPAEVEALPQRGNRTNRRGRGGGKQGPNNLQTEVSDSVVTNGE